MSKDLARVVSLVLIIEGLSLWIKILWKHLDDESWIPAIVTTTVLLGCLVFVALVGLVSFGWG